MAVTGEVDAQYSEELHFSRYKSENAPSDLLYYYYYSIFINIPLKIRSENQKNCVLIIKSIF